MPSSALLPASRLTDLRLQRQSLIAGRSYRCQCGRHVFFRNTLCLACQTPLGYEPDLAQVVPLKPGAEAGLWQLFGSADGGDPGASYRRCANFETPAGCNWLVPLDAPVPSAQSLCVACRLNRTIPDLSLPQNGVLWGRIETAKRRLVSSLLALGLPVRSKLSEDPQQGLAFDFLQSLPGGPAVMTGHADGIITLNIDEADDAKREHMRQQMHEPYRTLLGHLRHEVGHYYWDRLVAGSPWLIPFRQLFGDERADYAAALQRHYAEGAPPDWALHHVSAYASVHPWEDWAETWAHYLHMVDTLDTALSFGLGSEQVEIDFEPFTSSALYRDEEGEEISFLPFVNAWVELTAVLNELSRSMGAPDFYPFVLSVDAVRKLHFVHLVLRQRDAHADR
ncbi:zinc-binding metallopeptidase family protein [Caldimonas brevitalea]|uniref:DNA polymerase III subunit gamma/tau n=1 Tax=Caldimonas brevitalea TaxID=413882 RepID=A0A0G3BF86_9BURK|nr:putative zinc-binding metallopeptidase [Caldimonas brevitalea]AKJ27977.1 DNA polymerase III subunit gamma/tau [Caldimonas brevitalea]